MAEEKKNLFCQNLVHGNFRIHIPHTLLWTYLKALMRRICPTIKASEIGDYFLYSHDLNDQFRSVTVRRNQMLVTLRVSVRLFFFFFLVFFVFLFCFCLFSCYFDVASFLCFHFPVTKVSRALFVPVCLLLKYLALVLHLILF